MWHIPALAVVGDRARLGRLWSEILTGMQATLVSLKQA